MSQELALSHYSRQWLGHVATSAKLTPIRSGQRWLLHLTPDSPQASTQSLLQVHVGLAHSGNCSPSAMPRTGTP